MEEERQPDAADDAGDVDDRPLAALGLLQEGEEGLCDECRADEVRLEGVHEVVELEREGEVHSAGVLAGP